MIMKISYSTLFNFVFAAMILVLPFVVGVTSSAWDPWLDTNEDGKIDITDITTIISNYGTMGDPGKNVTIVERASKLVFTLNNQIVAAGGWYNSPWIPVDGYSKVTVCIYFSGWESIYRLETSNYAQPYQYIVDVQTSFGTDLVKTYDVPNEQIAIRFKNNDVASRSLYIEIYLVP